MKLHTYVNGKAKTFDILPDDDLLEVLRKDGMLSIKIGCDTMSCGICHVLIDNQVIPSCSYLAIKAEGKHIITIEGIKEEAYAIAEHFGHEGADQCGYCNSSLALSIHAMLQENQNPTSDDIRHYLVGNLCRCTGYEAQHRAIQKYMEDQK